MQPSHWDQQRGDWRARNQPSRRRQQCNPHALYRSWTFPPHPQHPSAALTSECRQKSFSRIYHHCREEQIEIARRRSFGEDFLQLRTCNKTGNRFLKAVSDLISRVPDSLETRVPCEGQG